jgi:hypothetical protein
LFTMAKVKLWTPPASTVSRTVPTKLAADVPLRVDRRSFPSLVTKNGNGTAPTPGRPAPTRTRGSAHGWTSFELSRRSSYLGPGLRSPYGQYYNGPSKRRIGCGITSRLVPKRLPTPRIHPFTVETTRPVATIEDPKKHTDSEFRIITTWFHLSLLSILLLLRHCRHHLHHSSILFEVLGLTKCHRT